MKNAVFKFHGVLPCISFPHDMLYVVRVAEVRVYGATNLYDCAVSVLPYAVLPLPFSVRCVLRSLVGRISVKASFSDTPSVMTAASRVYDWAFLTGLFILLSTYVSLNYQPCVWYRQGIIYYENIILRKTATQFWHYGLLVHSFTLINSTMRNHETNKSRYKIDLHIFVRYVQIGYLMLY